MQSLFWCGTVMLLSKVMHHVPDHAIDILLEEESVTGNVFTYRVKANGEEYSYHYSMDSNTRVVGEFFISQSEMKSPVYVIEKQNGYYHIAASSYQYDDVIFVTHDKLVVVTIDNGKKSAVMTFSIDGKGFKYKVIMTKMEVHESEVLSPRVIRNMFMISGAIDQIRTSLIDPVAYETKGSSMLSYSDEGRTIVGVEYAYGSMHPNILKSINTDLGQYFEFKYDSHTHNWQIHESAFGFNSERIVKRYYTLRVDGVTIIVNEDQIFTYELDDGHLIFKKDHHLSPI